MGVSFLLYCFHLFAHNWTNDQTDQNWPTFAPKKRFTFWSIFEQIGCTSSCWSFWSKPHICSLKRRTAKSMMVGKVDDLLAGLASTIWNNMETNNPLHSRPRRQTPRTRCWNPRLVVFDFQIMQLFYISVSRLPQINGIKIICLKWV